MVAGPLGAGGMTASLGSPEAICAASQPGKSASVQPSVRRAARTFIGPRVSRRGDLGATCAGRIKLVRSGSVGRALLLSGLAACSAPAEPDPWPPPPECLEIEGASMRRQCLEPHLQALAREESAEYAVCQAARLQANGTIDDCHLLAHAIGETNLEIEHGDAGAALATCGGGCIEGCMHGVMQTFVRSLPREVDTVGDAVYPLCDGVDSDLVYACVHGVGHGLRSHGFLELLDALGVCAGAPDHDWAETCMGGVLMEQVDLWLPLQLEGLGDVLPRICADLEGDSRYPHCVAAIGEGLMFRTGHDLTASEDLCLRLAAPDAIAECVHGARTENEVVARNLDGC